jgi:hypothetical protein
MSVLIREPLERRLAGPDVAADEERFVRRRVESTAEQADVVRGTADIHPRDDSQDADSAIELLCFRPRAHLAARFPASWERFP